MKRPNILILQTDQQRWDALGVNGNIEIKTPHLDRLADQGINFSHCFVQNPVCMPSRVSFLTGQYPMTLGIGENGVPVPGDSSALPSLLRPYGYASAIIGKLHFLPHANRDHRERHPDYGFDHLEVSDEPGCYEDAYRAWVRRIAPDQIDRISLGLPPATYQWRQIMRIEDSIRHLLEGERDDYGAAIAFPADDALTHSAFVAAQTIEFLQTHADRPFLCVAGFYSPHAPLVAPQRFLDLYDPAALTLPDFPSQMDASRSGSRFSDERLRMVRHGYYAMVSEVDHHVGRILDGLDSLGLRENTIVLFTSDHGEWLGEHLRYGKGYPGHDACSRVPLILRWPAGITIAGYVEHDLVEAIDVVPTLLECAGIQLPRQLQGRSLLPLLQGKEHVSRRSALTEGTGWKSLRTERYRYVIEDSGREFLYDLAQNALGYCDVVTDVAYAPTLATLRHELLMRLIARERPLPRTWTY